VLESDPTKQSKSSLSISPDVSDVSDVIENGIETVILTDVQRCNSGMDGVSCGDKYHVMRDEIKIKDGNVIYATSRIALRAPKNFTDADLYQLYVCE
jgi:hypothetical protein